MSSIRYRKLPQQVGGREIYSRTSISQKNFHFASASSYIQGSSIRLYFLLGYHLKISFLDKNLHSPLLKFFYLPSTKIFLRLFFSAKNSSSIECISRQSFQHFSTRKNGENTARNRYIYSIYSYVGTKSRQDIVTDRISSLTRRKLPEMVKNKEQLYDREYSWVTIRLSL